MYSTVVLFNIFKLMYSLLEILNIVLHQHVGIGQKNPQPLHIIDQLYSLVQSTSGFPS